MPAPDFPNAARHMDTPCAADAWGDVWPDEAMPAAVRRTIAIVDACGEPADRPYAIPKAYLPILLHELFMERYYDDDPEAVALYLHTHALMEVAPEWTIVLKSPRPARTKPQQVISANQQQRTRCRRALLQRYHAALRDSNYKVYEHLWHVLAADLRARAGA